MCQKSRGFRIRSLFRRPRVGGLPLCIGSEWDEAHEAPGPTAALDPVLISPALIHLYACRGWGDGERGKGRFQQCEWFTPWAGGSRAGAMGPQLGPVQSQCPQAPRRKSILGHRECCILCLQTQASYLAGNSTENTVLWKMKNACFMWYLEGILKNHLSCTQMSPLMNFRALRLHMTCFQKRDSVNAGLFSSPYGRDLTSCI